MTRVQDPITPRRPTLYATLDLIIQTEHADKASAAITEMIPRRFADEIAGIIREVARRSYVDGLRDGFVQGVEQASEDADRQQEPEKVTMDPTPCPHCGSARTRHDPTFEWICDQCGTEWS